MTRDRDLGLITEVDRDTRGFIEVGSLPYQTAVSMHTLLEESHEQFFLTSSDPDRFCHPHQVYAATAPLVGYVSEFFNRKVGIRGSLARHAAYLTLSDMSGESQRITRYQPSRILRNNVLPAIKGELEEVGSRRPEISRAYLELVPGPDLVDLKVDVEANSQAVNRFFDNLPDLIGRHSLHIVTKGHIRNPEAISYTYKDLAHGHDRRIQNLADMDSHHIQLVSDDRFKIAALLPVPVYLAPISSEDWIVLQSYPQTIINPGNPHDLALLAREYWVKGQFRVAEITMAAALGDGNDPLSKIYPIAVIHTIFENKRKENTLDTRLGDRATSHEVLAKLAVSSSIGKPPRFSKAVASGSLSYRYAKPQVGIWVQLAKNDLQRLNSPVTLGKDWENFDAGSPEEVAAALEVLSRADLQAIDSEIQFPGAKSYLDSNLVVRCAKVVEISDQTIEQASKSGLLKGFEKNLLFSFFALPHRNVQYLDMLGLWKKMKQKRPELPDPDIVLQKLDKALPREKYIELVRGGPGGAMTLNQQREYINGWKLIDDAAELSKVFPETDSYLERVYLLCSLI